MVSPRVRHLRFCGRTNKKPDLTVFLYCHVKVETKSSYPYTA